MVIDECTYRTKKLAQWERDQAKRRRAILAERTRLRDERELTMIFQEVNHD